MGVVIEIAMLPALNKAKGFIEDEIITGKNKSLLEGQVDAIKCLDLFIKDRPFINLPDNDDSKNSGTVFHSTTQAVFDITAGFLLEARKSYHPAGQLLLDLSEAQFVEFVKR